jgi:hypothetical protein
MPFWRDGVAWLLLVAALGCFVVGGYPQWSESVDPATGDKLSEFRMGLWSSPVYESVHREYDRTRKQTDERGTTESRHLGFEWRAGPRWLAWSWLVVALGFVCLSLLYWRREAVAGAEKPTG